MTVPLRVGAIVIGADAEVAAWVASRIPHMQGKTFGDCRALGVIRNEVPVGGVVYHNYQGHDCQVSIALDRVAFMPWRALFAYPFEQLGCRRITAIVGRGNKKSRKLAEVLGFKLEGVHPKGLDGVSTAFSFGMLRENCRWLRQMTPRPPLNDMPNCTVTDVPMSREFADAEAKFVGVSN